MTTAQNIQEATPEFMATLDFIVGIDTSGSTSKPSHRLPRKSRFEEMQEEVGAIARAAQKFDSDGLTVVQFATRTNVVDGVTADRVESVFAEHQPGGSTNLGDCIRQITVKAKASTKPGVVAFIFTDGEANDSDDVIAAIKEATKVVGGRPKLGITIVQIGQDPDANKFLKKLDDDLEKQGIPDMISVVTEDEAEGLTFGNLVWLAQNA